MLQLTLDLYELVKLSNVEVLTMISFFKLAKPISSFEWMSV